MKHRVEWGLLIGRVIFGIIMLAHGIQKWKGIDIAVSSFSENGLPAFLVYAVATIEAAGGLAVILGIFVPIASALLGLVMIGAIIMVKFPSGLIGGYELNLALLGLAVVLTFGGSRKWAFYNTK
jgi:putative oxidoreductase